MRKTRYWLLFVLGLLVAGGTGVSQTTPGYMDADYYFYGGKQLVDGEGFTEMILWNYLDDPTGLPHPSHIYWMPLPSITAAIGMKLFSFLGDFKAAQVGFILVAAAIPPLTAGLCMALTKQERKATLAGVLAAFSGFFLPFSTTTEAFGLYMLFGGAYFLVVLKYQKARYPSLGGLAGLMHLTRADGVLWVFVAGLVLLSEKKFKRVEMKSRESICFWRNFLVQAGGILLGYFLVMGAWYVRNFLLFDKFFPPGSSQTMWLLTYNELFSYPASLLTFERWWASGLGGILQDRAEALWLNLQTGFAVQGLILLGPLALMGAWKMRRESAVRMGWVAWLLIFTLMTMVFPYSGVRGGFFHSGAAFMPLVWALVPIGSEVLTKWTVKRFDWEAKKIGPFFRGLAVVYVTIFSIIMVSSKIFGLEPASQPVWGAQTRHYLKLENRLQALGAPMDEIVMVNNPPGYIIVSDRAAIVIPDGGVETLMAVVRRYHPGYILLEPDHPVGLDEMYNNPGDVPGLVYVETFGSTHIFLVEE